MRMFMWMVFFLMCFIVLVVFFLFLMVFIWYSLVYLCMFIRGVCSLWFVFLMKWCMCCMV